MNAQGPSPAEACLPGQPGRRPQNGGPKVALLASLAPPWVLPGGGRAAGTAAGISPSGLPRGPSPSASLPCWTTTQRVTDLTELPGASRDGAHLCPTSHEAGLTWRCVSPDSGEGVVTEPTHSLHGL